MKIWPIPNSFNKKLPKQGSPGSFWEDRNEKFNCGVDIYAPDNSEVLSIESGFVVDVGIFSTPDVDVFWNTTYYIIIKSQEKINYKYAELHEIYLKIGDVVNSGEKIGKLGKVLNFDKVSDSAPFYIRELVYKNTPCKLHLELYKAPIMEVRPYYVGNFLGTEKPLSILDPNVVLSTIK